MVDVAFQLDEWVVRAGMIVEMMVERMTMIVAMGMVVMFEIVVVMFEPPLAPSFSETEMELTLQK